MALNADTMLDRLHLKSQVKRWRLLFIVAITLIAIVFTQQYSAYSPIERDYVARVTIDGVIQDDAERDKLFEDLMKNRRVKAVLVRLNTPGGSAVGGLQIYRQLRTLSEKVPVVAVMRDMSASAGYLTAVGADRIYASEGTLTGSIGVIIQTAEFTELAAKLGVNPMTIKSGPNKDTLSPLSKSSPEGLKLIQDAVDDFYHVFVDLIAERRKLPHEDVMRVADGRVMTGRQAIALKLIDALGDEKTALEWLKTEKKLAADIEIRDVEKKKLDLPWMQQIGHSIAQKILPASAGHLDGLQAIWHPDLQIQ